MKDLCVLALTGLIIGGSFTAYAQSVAYGTPSSKNPAASVQHAVNLAGNGDHIFMSTGTFYETVIVSNKNLIFEGGYNDPPTTYIGGYTTIDASGAGTPLWFIKSRTSSVENVNLVHGSGEPINFMIGGGCLLHESTVEFNNTTFASNSAAAGGGLFVGLFSYALLDGASRVFSNTVLASGGGIYVDGRCDIVHEDADVFDNVALDNTGGGIHVETGYLRLYGADVYGNTAVSGTVVSGASSGGGIHCQQSFLEMAYGASVAGNTADFGGGISMISSTGELGSLHFRDVHINGNLANLGGGVFALNSAIALFGVAFEDNTAEQLGGGMMFGNGIIASVTNPPIFNRNHAGGSGGGLYMASATGDFWTIAFGEGPGDGNTSGGNGGGLYASNCGVRILGGRFMDNRATNSSFNTGNGGGMALYNSHLVISNNLGGYLGTYTNVIFQGNRADPVQGYGGALHFVNWSNQIHCFSADILSNSAAYGGGVSFDAGTFYGIYSRFEDNLAYVDGGGTYLYGSVGLMAASELNRNRAYQNGGAVCGFQSSVYSDHGHFTGNIASNSGGAIYASQSTNFIVYAFSSPFYSITNGWPSLFEDNTANAGGAIRADGCEIFGIQRTAFISNDAGWGLAVDIYSSDSSVSDSLFAYNGASGGWGLRLIGSTGTIVGSTFVGDGTSGGIDAINNTSFSISNSIIWNCGSYGLFADPSSSVTVMYSCVEGGAADPSNIDQDPQLLRNYHLPYGSPCIDGGAAPTAGTDIDGETRIGSHDIGCDEFRDNDSDHVPDIVETGTGIWVSDIDTGGNPSASHSDGDGVDDGEEWIADTNPNDADHCLRWENVWLPGGQPAPWIRLISGNNAHLHLEFTSSCATGEWTTSVSIPPPTGGTNEFGLTPDHVIAVRARAHR